jgi:hypothetical protein
MMERVEINVLLLPMKSEVFGIALALNIVAGKAQKRFAKRAPRTNKSALFNSMIFDFTSSGDHRRGSEKTIARSSKFKSFTPTQIHTKEFTPASNTLSGLRVMLSPFESLP